MCQWQGCIQISVKGVKGKLMCLSVGTHPKHEPFRGLGRAFKKV